MELPDLRQLAKSLRRPETLRELHEVSDKDSSTFAQHHTIGRKPFQAAAGNHFTHKVPVVKVRQTVMQTLTTGVATTLTFDVLDFQTFDFRPTGVTSSQIRIPVAGIYEFIVNIVWATHATGTREIVLLQNGGAVWADRRGQVNDDIQNMPSGPIQCAVGDLFTVQARQTSGVGNLLVSTAYAPTLSAKMISELPASA